MKDGNETIFGYLSLAPSTKMASWHIKSKGDKITVTMTKAFIIEIISSVLFNSSYLLLQLLPFIMLPPK